MDELTKLDTILFEAVKEVDENDYSFNMIISSFMAGLECALTGKNLKRNDVRKVLREASHELAYMYINKLEGSDKSE